jgi:hypothetical protein
VTLQGKLFDVCNICEYFLLLVPVELQTSYDSLLIDEVIVMQNVFCPTRYP